MDYKSLRDVAYWLIRSLRGRMKGAKVHIRQFVEEGGGGLRPGVPVRQILSSIQTENRPCPRILIELGGGGHQTLTASPRRRDDLYSEKNRQEKSLARHRPKTTLDAGAQTSISGIQPTTCESRKLLIAIADLRDDYYAVYQYHGDLHQWGNKS